MEFTCMMDAHFCLCCMFQKMLTSQIQIIMIPLSKNIKNGKKKKKKQKNRFVTGPPPIAMYLGTKKTICHLVKKRRQKCCLKWGEDCLHCDYKNSTDPRWHNQLIILAGQCISRGIFNFIVPLRSQFISMKSLSPIILLFEEKPDKIFLETIAHFPMVYWMQGKITNVDDLLKAGINKASHLVVVNRESSAISEEVLIDSETIVDVQTVSKLFPNTNIITELSQTQNMRFMQFQAHDQYTQNISRLEKKLKEEMHSSLTHIFRLPFAAGQTFVKGYLIKFVRLLLGIDAEKNSGHLSSIKVKRSILAKYRTYGELYKGLCSVTGEIPIAIYRTERPKLANKSDQVDGTNNNLNYKKGKRIAERDNNM
ncbi:hypothetical protein KUTeg_020962 [Tegillarca granosa]|uniref:RCK N-terminal domain-containing protein n=1 Tax=Tegillarca granosa TaxID=220873 RepID=A0ABQ9EEQ0_TEGGR|nr:hypothetical protein KUTeg_020962 [Tegillarca granosa]